MLKRIFHPIGQGAFYSEQFFNEDGSLMFTAVYDCGSITSKKKINEKIIASAFDKGNQIDVLFISHFDEDHVNRIDELKSNYRISKVIMPLLESEYKDILIALSKSMGYQTVEALISNPESFFGDETIIFSVDSGSIPEIIEGNDPKDFEEIVDIPDRKLSNGISLRSKSINEWLYIPYNYLNESRGPDLKRKLIENHIDVNKLGEVDYVTENKNILKKVYESMQDGINQNSLFLYSGPSTKVEQLRLRKCCYPCACNCILSRCPFINTGCVYTGDGDLNKVSIKTVYGNFWNNVSTVQIPHHGSEHNFSADFLDNPISYKCVISCGLNRVKHPSYSVLKDLIVNNSYVRIVSEDISSLYCQFFSL